MTVANNYAPVVVAANGSAVQFSGPWNPVLAAYLVVQLLNTATGVYTSVMQGTGPTQYQVLSLGAGGFLIQFNTAPATGNNVVISRNTTQEQEVPYTTSTGFQGPTEEQSFDILTNMIQETSNEIRNSIRVSNGDAAANLVIPIASLRANGTLGFDANGNVVVGGFTSTFISPAMIPFVQSPTVTSALNNISYLAPATGAVARTVESKFTDAVSVLDFGANPSGAGDSTAAIQFALAYAASNGGGLIYAPHGTYKYSALTVPDAVTILGDGWAATTLETSSAAGNCFTMGTSSGLEDLQLASAITRTSGAYVNIQNNAVLLRRLSITGYYQGILVGAAAGAEPVDVQILDCNFFSPAVSAGGFGIFGANFSNLVIDNITMSGPTFPATQPDSGIRLQQGDTCMISNTNVSLHGIALWVVPPTGGFVGGLSAVNSYFDNAGSNVGGSQGCVEFNGAGLVENTKFANCWFGLSHAQSGCEILPVTGGVIDGLSFSGCEFIGNADCGLIFGNSSGGTVRHLNVSGGGAGGNTNYGIRSTGASNWTVTGVNVGAYSNRGPNGIGIGLDAAANSNWLVAHNNVWGNTTNISDASTGNTGQIINNAGYNGVAGSGVVSLTGSPMTYTAGHTPEILYFAGGTISSITMDGNTLLNQTSASVTLPPNQAIVITYSSAPTVVRKRI